jgi:hypothetical protein
MTAIDKIIYLGELVFLRFRLAPKTNSGLGNHGELDLVFCRRAEDHHFTAGNFVTFPHFFFGSL